MISGIKKRLRGKFGSKLNFDTTFKGKKVFITGHTGFKGSWLSFWLSEMGAVISGYSLEDTIPDKSLFASLSIKERINNNFFGDIRNDNVLKEQIKKTKPDFVFHLAAQSLVRLSYCSPSETYSTNVNGTINLLEAVRDLDHPCVVIIVTSDKCYENFDDGRVFRETDPLGGHDPYSSSKACAEIVVSSWRRSFLSTSGVMLASVRAGNVIGGGDWARDRIVPDVILSLNQGKPIEVRNPNSVRPWQHVLDPLNGYLQLAHMIHQKTSVNFDDARTLCDAFNFGPEQSSNQTVEILVNEILQIWNGEWIDKSFESAPHEAAMLKLDISKARELLNWYPIFDFKNAVSETINWYKEVCSGKKTAEEFTKINISNFEDTKKKLNKFS